MFNLSKITMTVQMLIWKEKCNLFGKKKQLDKTMSTHCFLRMMKLSNYNIPKSFDFGKKNFENFDKNH